MVETEELYKFYETKTEEELEKEYKNLERKIVNMKVFDAEADEIVLRFNVIGALLSLKKSGVKND